MRFWVVSSAPPPGAGDAAVFVIELPQRGHGAFPVAKIVEEHALLRRLITVSNEIAEMAYGVPDDVRKPRSEALAALAAAERGTDPWPCASGEASASRGACFQARRRIRGRMGLSPITPGMD